MAEHLIGLDKADGNSEMPFLGVPDVNWIQANFAYNATHDIAVTQMPKYIWIAFLSNTVSAMSALYDVSNNKGYALYTNKSEAWADTTWTLQEITSSNVKIRNGTGGSVYANVAIYY